jgi:hemerythrin-like domain-containing protein
MPVIIGEKPQSHFSDPIGLLTDCHRRIERFLGVLVRIAGDAGTGPLTDGERSSWETALDYFRDAAPRHTADEEVSLFPVLRRAGVEMEKVDGLEADHARADVAHREVERLGRGWLAAGALSRQDAETLTGLLEELTLLYRGHIAIEEGEVFPAASRVLGAGDRERIGREMRERRGLAG